MAQEKQPFGFRMPVEVRAEVERRAKNNGRSLNSELIALINLALGKIKKDHTLPLNSVNQGETPYLTEYEDMLLKVFRQMPVDKQLALLSLFK